MERRKGHSDAEYLQLFKEMTDMLIEIVENDDRDGKKAEYLDRAITHWNMRENKKNGYSKCIYKPPPKELKFCYRCAEVLEFNHQNECRGKDSQCTHCGKIGHLKICCGQLGYFPCKTK